LRRNQNLGGSKSVGCEYFLTQTAKIPTSPKPSGMPRRYGWGGGIGKSRKGIIGKWWGLAQIPSCFLNSIQGLLREVRSKNEALRKEKTLKGGVDVQPSWSVPHPKRSWSARMQRVEQKQGGVRVSKVSMKKIDRTW